MRPLLSLSVIAATSLFAQVDPPKIRFDANASFLKLPPNLYLLYVAEILNWRVQELRLYPGN